MSNHQKNFKAVVLLSGGVDSALCLKKAINDHGGSEFIAAISYDYGQKHVRELESSKKIAESFGVSLHKIIDLNFLSELSVNALTSQALSVNERKENGDVATLVVGRNGLFMRLSAIWGNSIGASQIYIGINELDTVNYRDCSIEYIQKVEDILKIDLKDDDFKIVTPISGMTKKETMNFAEELGVIDFVMNESVTCYNGIPADGCGECLACKLRREGLEEYLREKAESVD